MVINGDCLDELARLPDASIHAVVTDPPYGLGNTSPENVAACLRAWLDGERHDASGGGFMGRAWDAWVPGPEVWRECLRALKPGGHVLAFAGTRTVDLMALALRLAGFEVRDMLAWHYGSGFPKSLDVSKAIDARRDDESDVRVVCRWLRAAIDEHDEHTTRSIAQAFGFNTRMVDHWAARDTDSQPSLATDEQWNRIVELLGVDDSEVRGRVRELNARKGERGEAWHQRESTGVAGDRGGFAGERLGSDGNLRRDIPATAPAREWSGWGTALKPSWEPIILARKPLAGTVAANVLEHGAGALNVDGCRVGVGDGDDLNGGAYYGDLRRAAGYSPSDRTAAAFLSSLNRGIGEFRQPSGRWPPNAVLVHPPHCGGDRNGRGCVEGCPVGEMGRQSGEGGGGERVVGGAPRSQSRRIGQISGQPRTAAVVNIGDTGTAARFFYQAKASRVEREAGIARPDDGGRGNRHPTVKPVDLMRWLVRLVTPPGGTVLDPFAGSGTTGCACAVEGFGFVGIEREPEYADIARQRVAWWSEHGERAVEAQAARDAADAEDAATGQTRLFD